MTDRLGLLAPLIVLAVIAWCAGLPPTGGPEWWTGCGTAETCAMIIKPSGLSWVTRTKLTTQLSITDGGVGEVVPQSGDVVPQSGDCVGLTNGIGSEIRFVATACATMTARPNDASDDFQKRMRATSPLWMHKGIK